MHPDDIRNYPEVTLGSLDPLSMDAAFVSSEMPSPCVNTRGVGQGRGWAIANSQANSEFSYVLQK